MLLGMAPRSARAQGGMVSLGDAMWGVTRDEMAGGREEKRCCGVEGESVG